MATTAERLAGALRAYARILDAQHAAIQAGKTRAITELAGLERRTAREVEAMEKALGPLPPGDTAEAARRAGLVELRAAVLAANQRNRELLSVELLTIRKLLVARRLKLGTPSVYADGGQASLIDITT